MEKKVTAGRKTHSGKIYDKERTKQKLIGAVAKIIKTQGYKALRIGRVADVAKVDKKLIYLYFGSLDKLVEAYLKKYDYWRIADDTIQQNPFTQINKEVSFSLLKDQFDFFESSPEMQNIILWELSEYNETLREIVDQREEFGKKIFRLTDKQFKNSGVNFRALNAIFVAAIYYLVLHSKANGSTVCEIDLKTTKGKKEILDTIDQVFGWAYEKAVPQKTVKKPD